MARADDSLSWPPPDPDRMSRFPRQSPNDRAFNRENETASDQDRLEAFRERQLEDLKRFDHGSSTTIRRDSCDHGFSAMIRRRDFRNQQAKNGYPSPNSSESEKEGWRDSEGDRLDDFGVDEDIEFYDNEDDVPLAELLRSRSKKD